MEVAYTSARVAVVGAGVSGLACARRLGQHGLDVVVFEKSRGTGGRAATHRNEGRGFDSGAQYFTAREAAFLAQLDAWQAAGVAAEWGGAIVRLCRGQVAPAQTVTRRFVGVPDMSAIARDLAGAGVLQTESRIERLEAGRDGITLVGPRGDRAGGFAAVVLAMPAPQAGALARSLAPELAAQADGAPFSSCIARMIGFESPLSLPFDAAFVDDSPLSWVARNSSKPGRSGGEAWVLHAAPAWSDRHFADEDGALERELHAAFVAATAQPVPQPVYSRLHRWRYALPTAPLPDRCLFDPIAAVGACGDWCAGPRVEGAFVSGTALAERVVQWFENRQGSRAGGA